MISLLDKSILALSICNTPKELQYLGDTYYPKYSLDIHKHFNIFSFFL